MSGLEAILDGICREYLNGSLDIDRFRNSIEALGFDFNAVIKDRGIRIGKAAEDSLWDRRQ